MDDIVDIMANALPLMETLFTKMFFMLTWLYYDGYETNADNKNIVIDITEDMEENWQLGHRRHEKCDVWKVYVTPVKNIHIHT